MTARRAHGQRGQTIVEFALAASVALLLLFAIIEFGRALYAYNLVAGAARVGTRFAITHATIAPHDCSNPTIGVTPCDQDIATYVNSKITGLDTSQTLTTTVNWEPPSATCASIASSGCYVRVNVAYRFTFVALPLPSQMMSSQSQMVISQ